jgi:hypothetical protein
MCAEQTRHISQKKPPIHTTHAGSKSTTTGKTPPRTHGASRHARRQELAAAAGLGDQALCAGLVGLQLYACDVTALLPPPMEKPCAQVVVTLPNVTPASVPPDATDPAENENGAQSTTAACETSGGDRQPTETQPEA